MCSTQFNTHTARNSQLANSGSDDGWLGVGAIIWGGGLLFSEVARTIFVGFYIITHSPPPFGTPKTVPMVGWLYDHLVTLMMFGVITTTTTTTNIP